MLVSLKHVFKSYGPLDVLKDISCTIEKGDRIALIGPNGVGKSTLLQIISRMIEADGGTIDYAEGVRVVFVPQERASNARASEARSVGESRRTALEKALAEPAQVFLLDEPTNNLDIHSLLWLERKIQTSPAAFLIVSHDRAFLDAVSNKIFVLDPHTRTLESMNATYSDYLNEVTRRRETYLKEYKEQTEELARLQELVREKKEDALRGAQFEPNDNDKFTKGFFRDRSKSSARRAKAIESKIDQIELLEKPVKREPLQIPLVATKEAGTRDITAVDAEYTYKADGKRGKGGAEVHIGPVSLFIPYGRRIGIVGNNGAGKSTLLKLLTGELVPEQGTVTRGRHCVVGSLMQEYEALPLDSTPYTLLEERSSYKAEHAFNLLIKFGISYEASLRPIGVLSPGLRARLLLALYSALSVNVLVLDEPTNNLDIDALQALEELFGSYKGSIVLVSHDRRLIEQTRLDEVYTMEGGKLRANPVASSV